MDEIGENPDFLESIIKVEPEEFQTVPVHNISEPPATDDISEPEANVFLVPIATKDETSRLNINRKQFTVREIATKLARRGNDGLTAILPHTCCFCQHIFSRRHLLADHMEAVHCGVIFTSGQPTKDRKFVWGRLKHVRPQNQIDTGASFQPLMVESKNAVDSLGSIVKSDVKGHELAHAAPSSLFSETIELWERLSSATTASGTVNDDEGETLEYFVKKGNEGLLRNDPHTCCICQAVLSTRRSLKKHLEIEHCKEKTQHAPNETFTCIICDHKSELKSDFYGHTLTHIKGESMKSRCSHISDPVERFELLIKTTPCASSMGHLLKIFGYNEIKEALLRKGNCGATKSEPHTCCLCQKVLSHRMSLKGHLEQAHCRTKFSKKIFACFFCAYRTELKSDMEIHKLTHPKSKCSVCKNVVTSLEKHMKIHNVGKSHKCRTCDEAFDSREELRTHQLRMHYKRQTFECHCGKSFASRNSLRVHEQIHDEKVITCEVCQRNFSDMSELTAHLKISHLVTKGLKILNWRGSFICDKCGSEYETRQKFSAHYAKYHRGPRKNEYIRINKPRILNKTGPFVCDKCGAEFSMRISFQSHNYKHHPITRPERVIKCIPKRGSRTHYKLKARIVNRDGPFICDTCGSKLSNRALLLRHNAIHHRNIKTYCNLYPRCFDHDYFLVDLPRKLPAIPFIRQQKKNLRALKPNFSKSFGH